MADHPLRPATDHCLGEPLPRQLANRVRDPPETPLRALSPRTWVLGISCGISPPFGGLSPISGQVSHILLTRPPCADTRYCYRALRTRLACVRHAASVRSEPGSNSRLNLVARKIKNPDISLRCRDQTLRANFLSLGSLNLTERVLACHPIVKEQAPLSSSWAFRQSESIAIPTPPVNLIRSPFP